MRRKYKDSTNASYCWGGDALRGGWQVDNRMVENPANHYLNLRYVGIKVYSRGNMSPQGGTGSLQSVIYGRNRRSERFTRV